MICFLNSRRLHIRARRDERGYVLLTMLLVISLMAITMLAVIPATNYQIKRDQEQEMIHRGTQYSRAIRTYFKKFGRYPGRLEDLDNTNNLRYLRKHYKDPLTGKDFKLLHYGEQGVTLAGGIAGASPIGSPNGLNGSTSSNSAFGGSSSGSGSGSGSAFGSGSGSAFGNSGFGNSGVNSNGVFAQSSSNSNSAFGGSSNSQGASGQPGTNQSSQSSGSDTQKVQGTGDASDEPTSPQQPVSGLPVVGVASTSKKTGLHEYNHKKKFNEWQFVYDPTTDRGGLITTPNQPSLAVGFGSGTQGLNPSQPGAQSGNSPFGQSGSGQSSFGQSSSSFGQSSFGQSSFGQSSSGNSNNNQNQMTPPAQPPSTSPQ